MSEDEFILLRRKLVDRVGVLLLHEWLPKDCRREATFERPSDSLELWVEPNEQWEAGDERGGVRRFSAAPGILKFISNLLIWRNGFTIALWRNANNQFGKVRFVEFSQTNKKYRLQKGYAFYLLLRFLVVGC